MLNLDSGLYIVPAVLNYFAFGNDILIYSCVTGFTRGQLLQLEDNTVEIEQREKEILSIVQSISDINEMYKDLATMIVEQVMSQSVACFSSVTNSFGQPEIVLSACSLNKNFV